MGLLQFIWNALELVERILTWIWERVSELFSWLATLFFNSPAVRRAISDRFQEVANEQVPEWMPDWLSPTDAARILVVGCIVCLLACVFLLGTRFERGRSHRP
ncbi:hypothetical protein KBD34_05495 [Patescibacteria group bacterium]|nr:hypothetical protein [Patescibacteria group bacterium]